MINVVVWLFCAGPMARCIAMLFDFFFAVWSQIAVKIGHVVSDMPGKKSIMLRRVVVMDMLPGLIQGTAR